jgi:hypothetical protein
MKYFLLSISLVSLFSCTRNNDIINPAPPKDSTTVLSPSGTLLDTVKVYILGPKEIIYSVTKYNYDAQSRLVGIYTTSADTSYSQTFFPDTSNIIINYQGTDTLPYQYTQFNKINKVFAPDGIYRHNLIYDGQHRIISDSETVTKQADHYSYSSENIFLQNLYGADTFYLNTGNLSKYVYPFETHIYTYSSYPNPWYFTQLGNHLGSVISPDMISINLYNRRENIFSSDGYTVNYSWTLNSDGQVVYGVGTDQTTGLPLEYYWFVYRK